MPSPTSSVPTCQRQFLSIQHHPDFWPYVVLVLSGLSAHLVFLSTLIFTLSFMRCWAKGPLLFTSVRHERQYLTKLSNPLCITIPCEWCKGVKSYNSAMHLQYIQHREAAGTAVVLRSLLLRTRSSPPLQPQQVTPVTEHSSLSSDLAAASLHSWLHAECSRDRSSRFKETSWQTICKGKLNIPISQLWMSWTVLAQHFYFLKLALLMLRYLALYNRTTKLKNC